jgi:hypothetical protein
MVQINHEVSFFFFLFLKKKFLVLRLHTCTLFALHYSNVQERKTLQSTPTPVHRKKDNKVFSIFR